MEKIDFTTKHLATARSASTARPSSHTDRSKISTGWNDTVSRRDASHQKKHKKEDREEGEDKKSLAPAPFMLFASKPLARIKRKESDISDLSTLQKREKKVHLHEDLSFVNTLAGTTHFATNHHLETAVTTGVRMTTAMDELYRSLVERIQEMKQVGKTELTVELKNLPLFEGVSLVVTEYASARGEYNLAFYNLEQQTQQLLVNPLQQDLLRSAMEQKGYAVHIIVATTESIKVEEPSSSKSSNKDHSKEESSKEEFREY